MAAPLSVGATAVFSGVDEFLGGIRAVSTAFGDMAASGGKLAGFNSDLSDTVGGFNRFNSVVSGVEASGRVIGATFSTITAPVRAVGSIITEVAGEVADGGGKIVSALGNVEGAIADLSEKGLIGVAAVGSSLVSLAAAAVTESARFERGMKDIQAVAQVSGPPLDELDSAIRRVATNFPASVERIQRSALELAKAGVDISAIKTTVLDLTVAAEQLSGGELTAEQAAEAVGSNLKLFAASFQQSGDSVEQQSARIINAIVAVANRTRATIPEVVSAITKLGPNTAPLGGSIEQTAALAGAVVAQGPRGQEAGTALANLIQRLERPSAQASKILEQRNISLFDVAGNARPVIDVVNDISNTYGKAAREISGMTQAQASAELAEIAQTRVLRGLNLILDNGVQSYQDFLGEIANTNVLEQASVQNEALIRQFDILINNVKLAGIAFGRDFVSGLGEGVRALNEFLASGDRVQAVAGVIGKAAASVLTGKGTEEARAAVSDSPFGTQGAATFDALLAGMERVKTAFGELLKDGGDLGNELGRIVFPGGVPDAISGTADLLSGVIGIADDIVKKFDEITPTVVADLQKITGASSFQELQQNVTDFVNSIAKIFTGEGGAQSFQNLQDAAVGFLATARKEAGPTALEIAKLLRAVEDAAPQFIALGSIVVEAFGAMTRTAATFLHGLTDIANLLAKIVGGAFNIEGSIANSIRQGIQGTPDFVRQGVERGLQGASGNFMTVTAADRAARQGTPIPNVLGQIALAGPDVPLGPGFGPLSTAEAAAAHQVRALRELPESARESASQINLLAAAEQEAAAAADTEAAAVGGSTGAYRDYAREQREADAANKALEQATKSLGSEMRTLDKDVSDVQGSFDKTIAGAREHWLAGMDQIAQSTADTVERIQRSASEARTKALESFNLQTQRSGGFGVSLGENNQAVIDFENQTKGFQTIFRRGQEDQKRDFQQGVEDRSTLRHQFAEDDSTQAGRHNEELTRIETQGQEGITRARAHGIEDQERLRTRAEEDELQRFTRGQERQLTAFQRGQETANTSRLRAREDQRASEDLARALGSAATPADRTKVLAQFTEDRRRTAQARQDQNEDTRFSQQQQDQLTQFRQTQENQLRDKRRQIEEDDVAHRRDLEISDLQFRQLLELDMIRFRRDLEDKETQRRRVAATLEITQTRKDQLDVLGFDRTQQQEAQLFEFLNVRIPDLQRQLRDIDTQVGNQTENAVDTAIKEILRTSATAKREQASAGVTAEEALRRLQERFVNTSQNLLERLPEGSPQRAALQQQIEQQQAVFSAQRSLAGGRNTGVGTGFNAEIDAATQRALAPLLPSASPTTIQQIFGGAGATVTTPLIATPQVDRLTTAIENLTNRINDVKPGVSVGTVQQTIQQPTSPNDAVIGLGTIGQAV